MKTSLAETQTLTNNTIPFYVWAPNESVVTYNYPSCYFRWIDLCAIVSHSPLCSFCFASLNSATKLFISVATGVHRQTIFSFIKFTFKSFWQSIIMTNKLQTLFLHVHQVSNVCLFFIQDPTLKVRFHLMNAGSWTLLAWTVLFKSFIDKNDIIFKLLLMT